MSASAHLARSERVGTPVRGVERHEVCRAASRSAGSRSVDCVTGCPQQSDPGADRYGGSDTRAAHGAVRGRREAAARRRLRAPDARAGGGVWRPASRHVLRRLVADGHRRNPSGADPQTLRGRGGRRRISVSVVFDPPVRRQRREYLAGDMTFDLLRNVDESQIRQRYERQGPQRVELFKAPQRIKLEQGVQASANSAAGSAFPPPPARPRRWRRVLRGRDPSLCPVRAGGRPGVCVSGGACRGRAGAGRPLRRGATASAPARAYECARGAGVSVGAAGHAPLLPLSRHLFAGGRQNETMPGDP
jgi:hypothetical protein